MMSNINDIVEEFTKAFDFSDEHKQQLDSEDMVKGKSVTECLLLRYDEVLFDVIGPVLPWLLIEWLTEPLDTHIEKNDLFVSYILCFLIPPDLDLAKKLDNDNGPAKKEVAEYQRSLNSEQMQQTTKTCLAQWENTMSVYSPKQREVIGMALRQMLKMPEYELVWGIIESMLESNYWGNGE